MGDIFGREKAKQRQHSFVLCIRKKKLTKMIYLIIMYGKRIIHCVSPLQSMFVTGLIAALVIGFMFALACFVYKKQWQPKTEGMVIGGCVIA